MSNTPNRFRFAKPSLEVEIELERETVTNEDGWIFEFLLNMTTIHDKENEKWAYFDIQIKELVNEKVFGTLKFKIEKMIGPGSDSWEPEWCGRNIFYSITSQTSGNGINDFTLAEAIHIPSIEKIAKTTLESRVWHDTEQKVFWPEFVWLS